MKRGTNSDKTPGGIKAVLVISLVIYLWYFISTLLLPLSEFINIPSAFLITFYKMLDFPPALLGFVICVSLLSCLVILLQFGKQKDPLESFLIDGVSLLLYFIIPIIATLLLIVFVILRVSGQIPSTLRVSYFLEDLFLFTGFLFLLTVILNIATKKVLRLGNVGKRQKEKDSLS
jgi:hypothetical protein